MLFKNISVLDKDFKLQSRMYVGISGDTIGYIGSESPQNIMEYMRGGVYEGDGLLLMSGFYNAHSHSPMTLLRGYGENLTLNNWLNQKIFPYEAEMNGESVYWGTMLAIAESLKSGIVSSSDMYFFSPSSAEAVLDSGVKMNISRAVVNMDGSDPHELASYKEMVDFCEEYHMRGMGRLRTDVAIHAEYTSDLATCEVVAEYGKSNNLHAHIHLSETRAEHERCKEKYGKTPTQYFAEAGMFDIKCTAAHCVWLENHDFDTLKDKNVTVASCPVSNMKLASGIADTDMMLQKGINLALGTDGPASNNSLNFFEEMKFLALGLKVWKTDPAVLSPRDVLQAATIGGARAQGRHDCGSVRVGNKADLVLVDIGAPNMQPIHDIVGNIVYAASPADVVMTIVDGKILYEKGEFKTIDIENATACACAENKRILNILGRGEVGGY